MRIIIKYAMGKIKGMKYLDAGKKNNLSQGPNLPTGSCNIKFAMHAYKN